MQYLRVFEGKRVLVTGHTGFKGAWLCTWLTRLGAQVSGLALAPDTTPNMFDLLGLYGDIDHKIVDVRVQKQVAARIAEAQPQMVFHLAAQPLVRRSYHEPVNTFETNTMGTAYVLEALRDVEGLEGVICITTDKVYENHEQGRAFVETDALGGKDPYSASKAAAEMVVSGYRNMFAQRPRPVPVATARGGNVIGGGDWSEDRLIPDLVRAINSAADLTIRNPGATRPWQHVLCLCHGYLALMQHIVSAPDGGVSAWNFGPAATDTVPVSEMLALFRESWTLPRLDMRPQPELPESNLLMLDSHKATARLGWHPAWGLEKGVMMTSAWYKAQSHGADMRALTIRHIEQYVANMKEMAATSPLPGAKPIEAKNEAG